LGVGPEVFTSFPGASSVSIWPTGYISYRRPGEPEPFVSPDDGLSIALLDLPWIKAGPVARFISGRTLSGGFGSIGSNGNFFGLHNVGFTAELGGFLELWPTDFIRARLEARGGQRRPRLRWQYRIGCRREIWSLDIFGWPTLPIRG
jgi:outer membrane protein